MKRVDRARIGAKGLKGAKKLAYQKKLKIHLLTPKGLLTEFLTAQDIQKYCHTSRANAYRWISGEAMIPRAMMELLQIKAFGMVPHIEWEGFTIDKDGDLITPDGYRFSPSEIAQFQVTHQENRLLKSDMNKMRESIEHIKSHYQGKALPGRSVQESAALLSNLPENVLPFPALER